MDNIDIKDLISNVEDWGRERGLDKTDPNKQFIKLVEEVAELGIAINNKDKAAQEDAVGDIMVVLTNLCMEMSSYFRQYDIADCFLQELRMSMRPAENFKDSVEKHKSRLGGNKDVLDDYIGLVNVMGELGMQINIRREETTYKSIGEMIMELINVTYSLEIKDIDECYLLAYEEIKDRKGKTIDGVFVKEADLVKGGNHHA